MSQLCHVKPKQHILKNQKTIGLLYLSIAIIGGFSMGYAPLKLIDIHNPPRTFLNLQNHFQIFQLSIFGDGLVVLLELFITVLLYQFFKNTHGFWNEMAKYSRLAMAFIMAINLVYYIIPLHLINTKFLANNTFKFCMLAHFHTVYIWQIFFGIHMIALAILTNKHPMFYKTLSFLLLLGGVGYLLDCLVHFIGIKNNILVSSSNILLGVAAISELSFAILLLLKKEK